MCEAASRVVRCDAVVVALATTIDDRLPLVGSEPRLRRFGDLQQAVVEGPEVEALRGGVPVVLDDVRTTGRRWPLLQAVGGMQLPVRTLVVEPLGADLEERRSGGCVGVLAVARHRVEPFRLHERAVLEALARLVTLSLLARREESDDETSRVHLERDDVALATGFLVGRWGVPPAEALARLRAEAFASDRTLRDVAAELLGTARER
jgi:hypothetical protein